MTPGYATGSSNTAFPSSSRGNNASFTEVKSKKHIVLKTSHLYNYYNNFVTQDCQIRQLLQTLAMSWELARPHHQNLTIMVSIRIYETNWRVVDFKKMIIVTLLGVRKAGWKIDLCSPFPFLKLEDKKGFENTASCICLAPCPQVYFHDQLTAFQETFYEYNATGKHV